MKLFCESEASEGHRILVPQGCVIKKESGQVVDITCYWSTDISWMLKSLGVNLLPKYQ